MKKGTLFGFILGVGTVLGVKKVLDHGNNREKAKKKLDDLIENIENKVNEMGERSYGDDSGFGHGPLDTEMTGLHFHDFKSSVDNSNPNYIFGKTITKEGEPKVEFAGAKADDAEEGDETETETAEAAEEEAVVKTEEAMKPEVKATIMDKTDK